MRNLPNQISSLFFEAATGPLYRMVALKPSKSWTLDPTTSIPEQLYVLNNEANKKLNFFLKQTRRTRASS